MPYISLNHASRIAEQIGAKVTVDADRAIVKIGNGVIGSTLTETIGNEPWISAHAFELITGIKPSWT